jgi:hypothetical protein
LEVCIVAFMVYLVSLLLRRVDEAEEGVVSSAGL